MRKIGSGLQKSPSFLKNEEHTLNLLGILRQRGDVTRQGGGQQAIERHHARGKLTARERIAALIDPGTAFLEIGLFAAYEMYEEYGGAPSSGTIFGIGIIHGREIVIVANDATVKA